MDKQGLLMCARYAVSPNFYGYCGPRKSASVIDHLKENIADRELKEIIAEFETLYPYLQLIARENRIDDPFDRRVVEAYWLGNNLLHNIKNRDYLEFLRERLTIEKRTSKKDYQEIKIKILANGFLPHHTFHVLNIFKTTAKDTSLKSLLAMDECRINYGKIILCQNLKLKCQTKILKPRKSSLTLFSPEIKEIGINFNDKKIIKKLKEGDWISFHWGMICDTLTARQVRNLEFYTQKAVKFFNN